MGSDVLLILNSGSSTVKFALYQAETEEPPAVGKIDRIGQAEGVFGIAGPGGERLHEQRAAVPDHEAARRLLFDWLQQAGWEARLEAVGHRVVHGGADHVAPQLVDADLLRALRELSPFAPEHLPHQIMFMERIAQWRPALPQVACFDTAFHRQMPPVAQTLALPRHLAAEGVIRYGFHGLSYEYLMGRLREEAGDAAADGRVIIAHLGNGASMAAIHRGRGLDTTMGFTPTGGLVMSTRSGDLDPGVLVYLLLEKGMDGRQIDDYVNRHAGLLGVSELSGDVQELLAAEPSNPQAAAALALFCYQARKFVGALAAALGGLDTLIFTAGIGENAPAIRARICEGLGFLGLHVDPERNQAGAPVISRDGSPVCIRVMKTDEERIIAQHTWRLVRGRRHGNGLTADSSFAGAQDRLRFT